MFACSQSVFEVKEQSMFDGWNIEYSGKWTNEPPPILFWFTVTLITGNQFPKTIQNYYGFLNCHCWAEVKEPGSMNYKIMFLLWQFFFKYNTKVLLFLVWVDVSSPQRGYYSFIYQKHNKEQNNKSIKKSK